MLDLLLAAIIGILTGIITGIIPGIHVNLVCAALLSLAPFLLQHIPSLDLACFIVSLAITHIFIDIVPSVFLGAPHPDQALSILPAHKLLMQGRGFEAVRLSIVGAFTAFLMSLLFMPIAYFTLPSFYGIIRPFMSWILITLVIILIGLERKAIKIFWAATIFLLSGALGHIALDRLQDPLLPLLSGAFGIAMLITAIKEDSRIPPQFETEEISIPRSKILLFGIASTFAGTLTALLPGLGASQGVALASLLIPSADDIAYIIIVAGVNMVNFSLSIVTLLAIDKARNGAIAAVAELMPIFPQETAMILIIIALISCAIAVFLSFITARLFARHIHRIDYRLSCMLMLMTITIMTITISGWLGLIVLVLSTCIGIMAQSTGIKKTHAMGCLILPVIVYLLTAT